MSEINSIANGTFTIGQTSANDSSLLVTENDSNVSILSTQQEVSHDNTLIGNGTVNSPLGVDSDYIVVTEETIGTFNVGNSDTAITGSFSKTGYKPISWKIQFSYAGLVNFNEETTSITNNTLNIGGYAHTITGSYSGIVFKVMITWVRV